MQANSVTKLYYRHPLMCCIMQAGCTPNAGRSAVIKNACNYGWEDLGSTLDLTYTIFSPPDKGQEAEYFVSVPECIPLWLVGAIVYTWQLLDVVTQLRVCPTCSRASRVRARWAKILMMRPTLSKTGRLQAISKLRCCTPLSMQFTNTLPSTSQPILVLCFSHGKDKSF